MPSKQAFREGENVFDGDEVFEDTYNKVGVLPYEPNGAMGDELLSIGAFGGGILGGAVGTAGGVGASVVTGNPDFVVLGPILGTAGGAAAGTLYFPAEHAASTAAGLATGLAAEGANKVVEHTPDSVRKGASDLLFPRYGDQVGQETAEYIFENSSGIDTLLEEDGEFKEYGLEQLPEGEHSIVIPETEQSIQLRGEYPFEDGVSDQEYEMKTETGDETYFTRGTYEGERELEELISGELEPA